MGMIYEYSPGEQLALFDITPELTDDIGWSELIREYVYEGDE